MAFRRAWVRPQHGTPRRASLLPPKILRGHLRKPLPVLPGRVTMGFSLPKGRQMMTRFPHGFVLTVMSDDHPGIVAAVSDAVESLGGNIDSCSQTVLGGYFTLIMIVSVPEPIDPERLAQRVRGAESRGAGYQVLVRPARAAEASADGAGRAVRDQRLRRGPAGHRPPLQPVSGRQGHQHRRSLWRPQRHAVRSHRPGRGPRVGTCG